MVPFQLEKLKQDSQQLNHRIAKMNKEGRSDIVALLKSKKEYIDSYIDQITKQEFNIYH